MLHVVLLSMLHMFRTFTLVLSEIRVQMPNMDVYCRSLLLLLLPKLWIGYHGREGKEDVQEKRGWKEYKQPRQQEI